MVAPGGHAWLLRGVCVVAPGEGMHSCSGGVCVVAPGKGHAWLLGGSVCGCSGGCVVALGGHVWLLWGACMVALGGHVWLLQGGGGVHGCSGGHAWLLWGGVCVVFRWFKFTLKPPNRITGDKLRLAILDTSFWTFWLKFGHKGP